MFTWQHKLLAFLWLISTSVPLAAHPISLSSTIVDVQPQQLRAEVEVMLEDLVLAYQLKADGDMNYAAADLRDAAKKHRKFVLEHFLILDEDGNRLPVKLDELVDEPIEDRGALQSELMRVSITYKLSCALERPSPKFLTFVQTFGGSSVALPALMDVHVLQNGRFVNKSEQIMHGQPLTIAFDWNQAIGDKIVTFAELKKRRAEQLRERLGIASYTGLFSFLYITPREVRHEILVPLATLQSWTAIVRKDPDYLDVEEQTAARAGIEKFFRQHATVTVNDQPIAAELSRLNFFGLDISDFALNADPRRVSVHQGRVGVILTYKSKELPNRVTAGWNVFSDMAPSMQSVVLVGHEAPSRFMFTKETADYAWSGKLAAPAVQSVVAPGKSIAAADRDGVLQTLLMNIYSAFEQNADGDVYDALATSVSGNLLREMYLKIKRSLLVAEQGGAMSRVENVKIISAEILPGNKPNALDVTWQAGGTTEHWGHLHKRTSEYRARLTILNDSGNWKIAEFQLISEKRLQFETSIRGDSPNP